MQDIDISLAGQWKWREEGQCPSLATWGGPWQVCGDAFWDYHASGPNQMNAHYKDKSQMKTWEANIKAWRALLFCVSSVYQKEGAKKVPEGPMTETQEHEQLITEGKVKRQGYLQPQRIQ